MKSTPTASDMETLLKNLPPNISPRLEKLLSSAPWTPRGIKQRRALTMLYLTITLLIAFLGLTPQGRAFAQNIIEFFTTTDQNSFPLSEEELAGFYTPEPPRALALVNVTPMSQSLEYCANPEDAGTYECEIKRVENELKVDLKEFSNSPPNHIFAGVWFRLNTLSANAEYVVGISYQASGKYLFLEQRNGNLPPDSDWDKVFSEAVQSVKIGEYDGEYANGSFGLRNGDDKLTWSATGAEQQIRWMEGDRWFKITALGGPGTSGYLDKEALISLASNMVYKPENSDPTREVNLEFIPNIALAEKICECNILQPTTLPTGMEFGHASYDPERKSIMLIYGYRALRIVQTPLDSALIRNLNAYKNVETIRVGETTGWYGISPTYKTKWESTTQPAFPVTNSYSVILWVTNDMVYQIYFDQSFSGGDFITKEQMIEIAESLK